MKLAKIYDEQATASISPVPPVIDHKDRNPANNRINNLREATYSINNLNTVQGVTQRRGRWRVRFRDIDELYKTLEEASTRRKQLMQKHGVI